MIQPVIDRYNLGTVSQVIPLGNAGGFSGARLWQIQRAQDSFCLRRWPKSHPTQEHLEWIHRVIFHARLNGCPVATPVRTPAGASIVPHNGFLWELANWMPGTADYSENTNRERLDTAVEHLAKFHMAAAQVSLDFRTSQNIHSRVQQLETFEQDAESIRTRAVPTLTPVSSELNTLRTTLLHSKSLAKEVLRELAPYRSSLFPVQPVMRDIWHDHLFFTENELTGIVDFGAMQMDIVSLDLARMLGSLINESNSTEFVQSVERYSQIRQLNDDEIILIGLLDRCGTLLGSMNWLQWLLVDNKEFDDWQSVANRLRLLAKRLQHLNNPLH